MPHERPKIHRLIAVAAAGVLASSAFAVGITAGPAQAAPLAACTWTRNQWELPAGYTAQVTRYDGQRWAVGTYGHRTVLSYVVDGPALWDNGKLVRNFASETVHYTDVNASGTIAGYEYVDGGFVGITVNPAGVSTRLPKNPNWESYDAWLINNRGDVVGQANNGTRNTLVIWPASAPGTYRELSSPTTGFMLRGVDEQGRVTAWHDTAGGLVWDTDGKQYTLAKGQADYTTPMDIRDGRVVGSIDRTSGNGSGAEWTAKGALTRTTANAYSFGYIGGQGTVGGLSTSARATLWRDGVVVDTLAAIPSTVSLVALSDDERTLVGNGPGKQPVSYLCS